MNRITAVIWVVISFIAWSCAMAFYGHHRFLCLFFSFMAGMIWCDILRDVIAPWVSLLILSFRRPRSVLESFAPQPVPSGKYVATLRDDYIAGPESGMVIAEIGEPIEVTLRLSTRRFPQLVTAYDGELATIVIDEQGAVTELWKS